MHVPQMPPGAHSRHHHVEKQTANLLVLLIAEDRLAAAPIERSECQEGYRGIN